MAARRYGVEPDPNAPEGSPEREAAERGEGTVDREESEKAAEELFGVDTESNQVIALAVATSIALAIAVLVIRSPVMLVVIAAFGIGAATFDVREVLHQLDESQTGVATLAALTAALHLLVAALAVQMLVAERRDKRAEAALRT